MLALKVVETDFARKDCCCPKHIKMFRQTLQHNFHCE